MNVHSRITAAAGDVKRVALPPCRRYDGAIMTITQRDARSVRVEHDGLVVSLAYRFWWEGRDRPPESIAVEGERVTAFFLSAAIRDTVTADAHGVLIRREWSVHNPGPVRLTVDVHLESAGQVSYLLPGVAFGSALPAGGVSAHGARTAWPSAACLHVGSRGTVGFALDEGPYTAGVAISPVGQDDVPPAEREEGPVPLSLALTLPGSTEAEGATVGTPGSIDSPGTLDTARTFRIVSAPARRAWLKGASAVLAAIGEGSGGTKGEPTARVTEKTVRETVRRAVEGCLGTHLFEKGGVAGLRIEPASPLLSASAGAGMAVLLRELFPSDPARTELALRLADFSLKGQHPSGLFYETYHTGRGEWQGVPGHPEQPVIGIDASARIADRLLALADALSEAGMPNAKYRLAGARFVEFFIDDQGRFQPPGALHLPGVRAPFEPGLAGFALCFPLARTLARTGRDRYRKALDTLAHSLAGLPWGTPWLPTSREGRDPDSAAALLCGRILVALGGPGSVSARRSGGSSRGRTGGRTGRGPIDVGDAASVVLPWVYANPRPPVGGIPATGGIIDSFHRQRLVGAGAEAAFVLSGLGALASEPWMRRTLEGFSRLCQGFADRLPLGTAYLAHVDPLPQAAGSGTRAHSRRSRPEPAAGPVDARRLVVEAGYRLAIAAGAGRKPNLI
jgi:hypothetical protein